MPKIVGVSRIRNESEIIERTLNHVAGFVDEILIYDDASEDGTYRICRNHPAVKEVTRLAKWEGEPHFAESRQRHFLVHQAEERGAEWVYIFDADDFASPEVDFKAQGYRIRFFDFYITPEDVDRKWYEREWMGPEYRDVLVLFRVHKGIRFRNCYGREPWSVGKPIELGGYGKHYSKAISVERWEQRCDFYVKYYKPYANKWGQRKGKAIHTKSDWGRPLIKWGERFNEDKIIRIR